jgi:putative transposase
MTNYRRNFLSGGSFFFTVNLADRRGRLLTAHVDTLRRAFRDVRRRHPFDLQAIVILPDHLHAVWTLPEGDPDFALRWRLIKTIFSHALPLDEPVSASRAGKGERGIWQRRYWEHTLRDEGDLARHLDYIHSFQSGEARPCQTCDGLAVFVVPSHVQAWHLSARLGRRGDGKCPVFRGKMMGIAEPVIGRRFAPTRWLHSSYGLPSGPDSKVRKNWQRL